ncbi:MAG: periplasmic heavy metal sensor [Elusimicrobia bacterium]|nr:periplasmic heavy metal sensor [Elusimicrobiota bacterium]
MNRRRFIIAFIFLAGTGLVAYGTWCCLDWMVKRRMNEKSLWASETWSQFLDLSPQQRSNVQLMEAKLQGDLATLQTELTQNQIALCRLMMTPKALDKGTLNKILGKTNALRNQKEDKMLNHFIALRETLNPGQQKRLFTALMRDVCQGCRISTGSKKDYCGLCEIR